MSKEYTLAIALLLGSILKGFGIEIENNVLEGLVFGVVALVLAVLRHNKGDITVFGAKKV